MTILTKTVRTVITDRIIEAAKAPREAALRHAEQALVTRLLRVRYGDDVFDRCRALPEGWLHVVKTITLYHDVYNKLPRHRVEVENPRRRYGAYSIERHR